MRTGLTNVLYSLIFILLDTLLEFHTRFSFTNAPLAFPSLQSWTKVLTHFSKTNAFYRRPSVTSKSILFVDSQSPSPPFQCCNTLRGHFHLVTTLKRGEGVEMSKLDIENSLVEQNGSFSENVSTLFVYDCSLDVFFTAPLFTYCGS